MNEEYVILNRLSDTERKKADEIRDYLISLSSDKNKEEIGRADLLRKYSGNCLLEIIGNSHISGDLMKNLDDVIREIILFTKESADGKCGLVEERCKDYEEHTGRCRKMKEGKHTPYRKSCRNSRFTLECKTLHLKFDYKS